MILIGEKNFLNKKLTVSQNMIKSFGLFTKYLKVEIFNCKDQF